MRSSEPIRVAQLGLGPIGISTIHLAATKPWLKIVAGLDVDPAKVGRTVGELAGDEKLNDAPVFGSAAEMLRESQPEVVLHTACSRFDQFTEQVEPIIKEGVSVVSSCEELIFPYLRSAALAHDFDELCRSRGARVVGTGVNPGFVMDVLPVCLTGVSRTVRAITVDRVVNASTRRLPLQKKIGSGLDPDEFRQLFAQGKAGHAGLRQSAALVAHSMGWQTKDITETCEPMIAKHDIRTQYLEVQKGLTCGLHQRAEAVIDGPQKLVLDLKMYLEADDPHDAITVEGDPSLEMVLHGGVAGDSATVAAVVNAIPRLLKSRPGLLLMTDLSVPSWV